MDSAAASNSEREIEFERFDVVPEADDHHYLSSNNSDKDKKCLNDNNAPLYSTIMKEWKILKESLPDSIYVQVYETRIDLLRAVIVGSPGTPYHDGLFFFDILLPSDYPNTPPKVHYHAHGYSLNPNLYDDGYVCLSLINTWSGSKDERWTTNSTILQILVSIQGLVLNERPYFNEPDYGPSMECEESIEYNEDAFVQSCWTMLQIVKKPPMGFEGFVARHFDERRGPIVAAIEAYQVGRALVGKYGVDDLGASSSSLNISPSFKNRLAEILEKIGSTVVTIPEANTEIGVDVKGAATSIGSGSKSGKKLKTDQENVEKKQSSSKSGKKVNKDQENEEKQSSLKSGKNVKTNQENGQMQTRSKSSKKVNKGQENVEKQSSSKSGKKVTKDQENVEKQSSSKGGKKKRAATSSSVSKSAKKVKKDQENVEKQS